MDRKRGNCHLLLHYPENVNEIRCMYSYGTTRAIKSTPKLIHFERHTWVIFTYLHLLVFISFHLVVACHRMLSRISHRCVWLGTNRFFFNPFLFLFCSFFFLLHYFDLLLWQIQYCAFECIASREFRMQAIQCATNELKK